MVVAQWINSQYLFSTINNISYGSGSKITQNIVGKIVVIQGNGGDLMHGLPLRSFFSKDSESISQATKINHIRSCPNKNY
jgi:hypothetical protein